jgi:hypothetical protein
MRNDLLIFAALLAALAVGYMVFHGRGHGLRGHAALDSGSAATLMREDYERAQGMRISVAEYYVSQGKMPSGNEQAGLYAPEEYRGQTLRSATVSPDGNIDLEFDEDSGHDGGHLLLVVDLSHPAMGPQWRCETSDYPDIESAIPTCRYVGR